jgi:molecular chaperone GrpE (heat shock protein)
VRTLADMENLRTRTNQQVDEIRQFALQGFAKDILDVADNLERALDSVPAELLEGSASGADPEQLAKNLQSLHNGVALSQKVRHLLAVPRQPCVYRACHVLILSKRMRLAHLMFPGADLRLCPAQLRTKCRSASVLAAVLTIARAATPTPSHAHDQLLQIMLKVFKSNGLEPVDCDVGHEFDPNQHNAMFELPTADVEDGKVATVVKRGWSLKGRVIRATDVGIARPVQG